MKNTSSLTRRAVVPSAAYLWRVPAKQALGSGVPLDVSGNGKNLTLGAANSDALAWANPGDMTTTQLGSTDGGFTIPGTGAGRAVPWDANSGRVLILCGEVNSAGAFGPSIMGDRTLSPGMNLAIATANNADGVAGGLVINLQDNASHTYTSGPLRQVANGSSKVSYFVVLNAITKTASAWVGGKAQTLTGGGDFSALTGTMVSFWPWGFGHAGNPSTSGTGATKQRNVSALLLPAGVQPPDVAKLAAYFSNCPDRVLPMSLVGA